MTPFRIDSGEEVRQAHVTTPGNLLQRVPKCILEANARLVAGENRIASRLETSFRLGLEFRFHTSRRCDWQRNRINGRRLGTARPFPLRRLHSGPQSSSFRSMSGNAPRTPESSVADAMRTSVVTRNYRQINSRVATRNSSGTDFKSHRSPEGFHRFANILSWSGSYSRHFSCRRLALPSSGCGKCKIGRVPEVRNRRRAKPGWSWESE
jgi:hypothetical protein